MTEKYEYCITIRLQNSRFFSKSRLTARAYLNTQKYGLFCSLHYYLKDFCP